MELGRITLGISPFDTYWTFGDWRFVCDEGLRKYFDVPREVTEIDLVAYDRPSKDRVSVELTDDLYDMDVYLDGGRATHVIWYFYDWIERFEKDTVYLSVEY